jgi:hypothetical protein
MGKRIFFISSFFLAGFTGLIFLLSENDITGSKSNGVEHKIQTDSVFCAKLRDGVIVVSFDEQEVHHDIVLANGMRIFQDGTVMLNNGRSFVMMDGECIDEDGNSVNNGPIK